MGLGCPQGRRFQELLQGSATSMVKVLPHGEVGLAVFYFLAVTGEGLAPSWRPLEMFIWSAEHPLALFFSS